MTEAKEKGVRCSVKNTKTENVHKNVHANFTHDGEIRFSVSRSGTGTGIGTWLHPEIWAVSTDVSKELLIPLKVSGHSVRFFKKQCMQLYILHDFSYIKICLEKKAKG